MNHSVNLHKRHRYPSAIIQYAAWLYHRFNLSHRDIEDLLAERAIEVSYESLRLWCNKFGPLYSKRLRRKHPGFGDTFFIDEVFVTIAGQRYYRRFSSPKQAQRFLSAHEAVYSLFNLQRQLVSAAFYRLRRARAFERWNQAVAT